VKNPNSGEKHFLYMTVSEIEEYAQTYSPAYPLDPNKKNKYGKVINSDSPWNKNRLSRIEMFKKTVLKRLLRKTAPLNPVVSRLLMQFDEEQSEERNAAFDGIDIKGTEEQEPKPRRSQLEIMSQMGFDNPDPIKDSTWDEWFAIKMRAEVAGVEVAQIDKAKTTEGDLKEYMREILGYVTDAERQAAAESGSQDS
jgi:recombinational DNA repair protein RecT